MTKGSDHSVFFSLTNSLPGTQLLFPVSRTGPIQATSARLTPSSSGHLQPAAAPTAAESSSQGPYPRCDIATVLFPPRLPRAGATSRKGMQTPSSSFSLLLECLVGCWGQTQPRPDVHIPRAPGVLNHRLLQPLNQGGPGWLLQYQCSTCQGVKRGRKVLPAPGMS